MCHYLQKSILNKADDSQIKTLTDFLYGLFSQKITIPQQFVKLEDNEKELEYFKKHDKNACKINKSVLSHQKLRDAEKF